MPVSRVGKQASFACRDGKKLPSASSMAAGCCLPNIVGSEAIRTGDLRVLYVDLTELASLVPE
jgi:hypothetical protein